MHLTAEVHDFCDTKIVPPQTIGSADDIISSSTSLLKQTVGFVPEMTHFTFKRVVLWINEHIFFQHLSLNFTLHMTNKPYDGHELRIRSHNLIWSFLVKLYFLPSF